MKHNKTTYIILALVFIASVVATILLPIDALFKGIFASPAILALIYALFQLMRDQASFERQLEIQAVHQRFNLGATSHMANKAFDKHIEFCEAYMGELQSTFYNLFKNGDTEEAIQYANKMFAIREKYAIWLTKEINEQLEAYEKLIRKLGASAHFIDITRESSSHAEQRSLHIDSNHELFARLMGVNSNENEIDHGKAIEGAKIKIKAILGVEALTQLRSELMQHATEHKV
jgi:hypothetical protein